MFTHLTKSLTTVATPLYLCIDMQTNQLRPSKKDGSCLIVGCRNKSGWDKGLYLAKVPSIIENQGKEARELSE